MPERIVVTGIGLVTPLGADISAFAADLCRGRSGIGPLQGFDTTRLGFSQAAQIRNFQAREHVSSKNLRKMDRLAAITAAAARLALQDAALDRADYNPCRTGIITGVAYGSTDTAAQVAQVLFCRSARLVNPLLAPNTVLNAPAGHTAIELGFRGINATVTQREASAETALAWAAQHLQRGTADLIIAGGADIISQALLDVLAYFKAVSPQPETIPKSSVGPEGARPFDRARNGLTLGEGAGMLCLETLTQAQRRGVRPYCELAGCGLAAAPAPATDWPVATTGPVLAIRRALQAARITPARIDAVSASANGSRNLDRLEARSLAEVFGANEASPWIFSLKGALGESFSSGGIRTAAMALAMAHGRLPPTLGLENPMQPLRFVMQRAQAATVEYGLVNGLAAGGTFVSLVLRNSL